MDIETLKAANSASLAVTTTPANKTVVVTNPTDKTLFTWIHSTVSFAKGELTDATNFGGISRPSANRIIKKYDDGSIALLGVKMPYFLPAGGTSIDEVGVREAGTAPFVWHPELLANLQNIISQFKIRCSVNGQSLFSLPLLGQWKALESTEVTLAFRYRAHFYTETLPATEHPLSCTVYAECETLSPVVKLTVVIGNDTLEKPVAGGIQVNNFEVVSPVFGVIQNESAYQTKSCHLADGQQVAFRYFMNASTDAVFQDTALALAQCEIIGLQAYEQHQASKGLLTHMALPNPRFAPTQVAAVHAQVDAEFAAPPVGTPKTHLGYINLNPPSTGDQPDFGAGHPMTKVLQSYSMRMFNRTFVAVMRESFRPSHYWENSPSQGLDYVSLAPYPSLFFWSGRPHWHPTWNPEYPVWVARGALNPGDFGGYGSQDNQHTSNNFLRACYELSGSHYLGDICRSYISVNYFNYFTKWANNTEAERCGRIMKEAYALCELFSETPEAQLLLNALQVKAGVYDNEVTANLQQYGVPAVAPFNSCDPRIANGVWCAPYPGNTVAVAWQTGFHMEWEFCRSLITGNNPDLRYLTHVDKYFALDGTPKTYFALPEPFGGVFGGIGISWWAGWILLAQKYVNDPVVGLNCQFILNTFKPLVNAEINQYTQGFFSNADRWKAWE